MCTGSPPIQPTTYGLLCYGGTCHAFRAESRPSLRRAAVLPRPSSETPVKPVTQQIVGRHRRDGPRSGPIEWDPWELIDVEGARSILAAQDFQCGLVPEISHHRYAAAVAAHRIVHTLVDTHMRNMIGGHAEVAAPAMGYTKGGELGPDFAHLPE